MKLVKIEIKSRYSGKVLFSHESENNTIKDTLLEAVRKNVDLRGANLRGADISSANLRNANLSGASLCNANLSGADLRCANLCNANLSGAYLRDADLRCANLCNANLSGAYLYCADIRCANLHGADLGDANLYCADLSDADLRGANLCGAILRNANLSDADLSDADLSDAILRNANLSDADLSDANLRGANLRGANLCGAKEIPFVPFCCPSEGSFIGWKKAWSIIEDEVPVLVKLEIPADARRTSATGTKCRCDKAKVLEITRIDNGEPQQLAISDYTCDFIYRVGETVEEPHFCEDRWRECASGIHFFINKQEAINYVLC